MRRQESEYCCQLRRIQRTNHDHTRYEQIMQSNLPSITYFPPKRSYPYSNKMISPLSYYSSAGLDELVASVLVHLSFANTPKPQHRREIASNDPRGVVIKSQSQVTTDLKKSTGKYGEALARASYSAMRLRTSSSLATSMRLPQSVPPRGVWSGSSYLMEKLAGVLSGKKQAISSWSFWRLSTFLLMATTLVTEPSQLQTNLAFTSAVLQLIKERARMKATKRARRERQIIVVVERRTQEYVEYSIQTQEYVCICYIYLNMVLVFF